MTAARRTIDWSAVRGRLAAVAEGAEAAGRLSPAQGEVVMAERARRIACPLASTAPAGEVLEVVTLSLGDERYAIEVRHVREIVHLDDVTPVPGTPPAVVGVTNLRGELLVVVDLRSLLGVDAPEAPGTSRIVVLGDRGAEIGALADAVHEVTRLPVAELLESPASERTRALVRGVTREAVTVLDGGALLGDRRLFVEQGHEPGEQLGRET